MMESVREYLVDSGCSCPKLASLTYRVYIEALEVKMMHEVRVCYDRNSKVPYLTAKRSKNSPLETIVPCFATDPITVESVLDLQNSLCIETRQKRITLAFVEADSTVVFYAFTDGFVNPQNSDYFVRHKTKQERRCALERELKRNAHILSLKSYRKGIDNE